MESQALNLLSPITLVAIGIALIALEVFILSFVFAWFGIAAIIIGIVTNYYNFDNSLYWQLASICIVALGLLFSLRTKALAKFLKPEDEEVIDGFYKGEGYGKVKGTQVIYKGTYWEYESEDKDFKDDEKVIVLSASKNIAIIKKQKNQ
jgi:membrane protein implicated in regulation of membrane protease activity